MILAAGRGERMRPLTDHVPKPLLRAGGSTLIELQLAQLTRAGVTDIVINVSHLGEQIERALGDGARYGACIRYSREPVALETAGGIAQALPLLGDEPFLAVNADIYCDFSIARAITAVDTLCREAQAWRAYLVMVDNPAHHPQGDFALAVDGLLRVDGAPRYTFSGIGIYDPRMFASIPIGTRRALGPLLREHANTGAVRGEHHPGRWMDIGTPERLETLRELLARRDGCA